ncbi:MAG: hypothetical protein ACLT6Y_10700 [Enterocloster sp.]
MSDSAGEAGAVRDCIGFLLPSVNSGLHRKRADCIRRKQSIESDQI